MTASLKTMLPNNSDTLLIAAIPFLREAQYGFRSAIQETAVMEHMQRKALRT